MRRRLLRHNGCIVADGVGLGKTWTALAVIKFFELRNERVLVLCPKRLEDNWVRYTAWAASHNNPFAKDRLNYAVRTHTDLSRYGGRSGGVDLAQFNWGTFDLVVIDESHNFRNEGRDRLDEGGNLVRRSRYNRLLEEVLKSGARTKVLMLLATPVNNNLRDLRNQIYLMTERRQDAFRDELGVHIALVTGGDGNRSSTGDSRFLDILAGFAPRAQQADRRGEQIDIVIATDCLSEGQNLQDCDLVVSYDIHWNPVRLMQRFGRTDRLGSRNRQVAMTNFWPTADLDRYLDLKNRVEARMALADAAATGLDDPLNEDARTEDEQKEAVQMELAFRDRQLMRMRDEILDIEEAEDGIGLNDLTLDDFVADLLRYVQQHRAALEAAPLGIHAVVASDASVGDDRSSGPIRSSV